ncbi:hypothetical protein [Streptomyces sp. NPDC005209]|uniref:hypothetical protein n=1 Tax=Streptomyces sp. NPDC005209 TaxID=3156715 RepID=UPI0033AEE075
MAPIAASAGGTARGTPSPPGRTWQSLELTTGRTAAARAPGAEITAAPAADQRELPRETLRRPARACPRAGHSFA